jgi:hypothetical protein
MKPIRVGIKLLVSDIGDNIDKWLIMENTIASSISLIVLLACGIRSE